MDRPHVIAKLGTTHTRRGCDIFGGVLSCAAMPYDEAERNVRLGAREVRPALQTLDGEARAGVPKAAKAAARQA